MLASLVISHVHHASDAAISLFFCLPSSVLDYTERQRDHEYAGMHGWCTPATSRRRLARVAFRDSPSSIGAAEHHAVKYKTSVSTSMAAVLVTRADVPLGNCRFAFGGKSSAVSRSSRVLNYLLADSYTMTGYNPSLGINNIPYIGNARQQ